MKIKKYIAKNLTEGKLKIKEELGSEAVILSTRKIKKADGIELIEIVAALDSDNNSQIPKKENPGKSRMINQILKKNQSVNSAGNDESYSRLLREIDSLKKEMNEINDNVKYKYAAALGPIAGKIFKILRKQEVPEDIALKLIGKTIDAGANNNLINAMDFIRFNLRDYIKIDKPLKKDSTTQKVVVFGGTGTGKTTALVRIGIISKLVLKADITLVSADTQKVGGAEQLETYASISGISFRTAYNSDELKEITDSEDNKDFIFIDTRGSNHKEKEFIDEIIMLADSVNAQHRFMVISATTAEETLRQQLECFKSVKPTGVILTKLDEAFSLGSILKVIQEIPVTYITTGQRIPEDLEPASKEMLIEHILPKNILETMVPEKI
jgi:flagellar biosynthesis protein FlhF